MGAYGDAGGTSHLFLLRDDEFTTFDLPGTRPVNQDTGGINGHGDIVGIYCDFSPCEILPTGTHGYVLRRGDLTTIDFPGALATGTFGINNHGDMVGAYYDALGHFHGYLVSGAKQDENEDSD